MLSWVGEMAAPPREAPPQSVVVDSRDGRADLAAALQRVAPTGGTVELAGGGPFHLPPMRFDGRKPLTIAAAPGTAPVVILSSGNAASQDALVRIAGGTVRVQGLHFLALAERLPTAAEASLFEVTAGALALQRCSITLVGSPTAAAMAVRLTAERDRAAAPRHVLLDRTFIRGANLAALHIDAAAAECVASNCLFVTGEAPVLALRSGEPADVPAGRIVQFFSCVGHARRTAFDFAAGMTMGAPPATRVVTMNSIFAASPQNKGTTLLALHDWPRVNPGRSTANLKWETDTCLFAGWNQLIAANGPALPDVTTADAWKTFWAQPSGDVRALPTGWPTRPLNDIATLTPSLFDPATLEGNLKTLAGHFAGINLGEIPTPPRGLLDRLRVQAERPDPSTFALGKPNGETVRVDLTKEDLGRVISGRDWKSGTRILATGSGTQKCHPFRIQGKSLRIEFVQSGSAPLVIEPQRGTAQQPWIDVSGGTLELAGGRFRIPGASRSDTPPVFLQVTDGNFALTNCTVVGPMTEPFGHQALIHWTLTGAATGQPFGLIRDCFLADSQPVLRTDLRGQEVVVQNSVLAGTADLLVMQPGAGAPPAAIDLRHCTLAGTAALFKVQKPAAGDDGTGPVLRLFAEQTVFAPPLEPGTNMKSQPVLFSDPSDLRKSGRIEWWGSSNGYAPELTAYVQGAADLTPPAGQTFSRDWAGLWGTGHEVRPLTGRDCVKMQNAYPHRAKITPSDFTLWTHAKAQTWGDGGRPIGAVLESPSPSDPKSPPEPKKPTPKNPARPTPVF